MKNEIVTTPERSQLMARVRQKGTSPENAMRQILHDMGIEFETNLKELSGSPDLVNTKQRWAIFVHGCFWHAHQGCKRSKIPTRNREYWKDKFEKNVERDKKKIKTLEDEGFTILVIWECELDERDTLKKRLCRFFYQPPYNEYQFSKTKKSVIRKIHIGPEKEVKSRLFLNNIDTTGLDARQAYDLAFLRKKSPPKMREGTETVRCVDLFSGCGGMSLGAMEACRALGKNFLPVAAVDFNLVALEVYQSNFKNASIYPTDINNIIDGELGAEPTTNERWFLDQVMPTKICMSGPPCKGHSDLNNHTRRNDQKNKLYLRVARFIEIAKPDSVIVENVPAVTISAGSEVQQSIEILKSYGYHVDEKVVDLSRLGVPQRRKRHILIGSLSKDVKINDVVNKYQVDQDRSVNWAIKDLTNATGNNLYDRPSRHSEENLERMRFLHENDIYDLPDHLRPLCHQNGDHSYKSMYGRIKQNKPAQTITGGFGSPGQGRFIHPTRTRTITAHEAARLQFFPDFFDFNNVKKKTQLSEMIGNAAPWIVSYVFCIEFLS